MADERSIIITVKVDKTSTSTTSSDGGGGNVNVQNQVNTSTITNSSDQGAMAKAAYVGLAMRAIQTAVNEGVAWAEWAWDRELVLNDDYVGQRNKQIAMTQINRGISAIGTVGSFALAGAAAGPVGAAVGAVIGAAVAVANIVRSNVQGMDQQNIMVTQMNTQLSFTRSRAGWSTKAASIGEDL